MKAKKPLIIGVVAVILLTIIIVAILMGLPKNEENSSTDCSHNLVSFEAKAPTCTEIGWDAYVTCSLCGYSTYAEKPAIGHSFEAGACIYCKADIWDGSVDVSWYNTTDKEFSLSSAEQLAGLAQLVNEGNTFEGITIKLAVSINLAGLEWTPIGISTNLGFSGNFDGQGNVISDLSIMNSPSSIVGFFGEITNGNISNVGIENPFIFAECPEGVSAGALAGHVRSGFLGCSISNCYVEGGEISASCDKGNARVGGLIGSLSGTQYDEGKPPILLDCYSSAKVILSNTNDRNYGQFVGGLVGHATSVNITNCYATGSISVSSFVDCSVGGLIGELVGDIIDCYATGEIYCVAYNEANVQAGGLIGSALLGSITNGYATGNVTAALYNNYTDGCLGGLIGHNRANIKNSYATGAVSVTADSTFECYIGGLVGENLQGSISSCYATGDISGNSVAGGLVGINSATTNWIYTDAAILNCYATGDVSCISSIDGTRVGGLVGINSVDYGLNVIIADSYATGSVVGVSTRLSDGSVFYSNFVGGLVGYNSKSDSGNISIINCYSTGDVTSTAPGGYAYAGNLIGDDFSNAALTNSYYCVGQNLTTNGYDKTHSVLLANGTSSELSDLKSVSFHTSTLGWSANEWNFVEGQHPTLKCD